MNKQKSGNLWENQNQSVQLHQVPLQVAQFDAFFWHQFDDIHALLLLHQSLPLRSQPQSLSAHFLADAVVVVVVDDVTVVSGLVVVVLVEETVVVEVLVVGGSVVVVLVVVVEVVDAVVLVVVKDPPGPSKGHHAPTQVSQLDWLTLQKSLIIWWWLGWHQDSLKLSGQPHWKIKQAPPELGAVGAILVVVVGGGEMVLVVVDGGAVVVLVVGEDAAVVLVVDGEVLSTTPSASNWSAM